MDNLNANQPPVVQPTEGVTTNTTLPPSKTGPGGSRKKFIIAIILVLVLLLGGGLAALMLSQRNKATQETVKQDIPLLRYGASEGPINVFYPEMGLIGGEFDVNEQIFEGLVRYENQTKIVPLLATSWTNPDDSTWVFTLKQGVKFHTGRTMTAQDVKASIDAAKAGDSDVGSTFGGSIKSVEVVDDYTVKIVTDGPDPILLNKLTFLYIFDTTSGKTNDPINGTGPYQVKSGTTPSEQELDLVAFDGYHGGHVYTREVQFVYYEHEAEAADDLKAGKLNMAGPFIQSANVQKIDGLQQFEVKTINVAHIGINTLKKDSPVSKLKVRQAIYLATDPKALFEVRGQKGEPLGQIVPSEIPGYNPAIERPARDVAKAKQLLAEAGYPEGITLTLSLHSDLKEVGTELVRQLAEAGITVVLDEQSDFGGLVDKISGGTAEIYYVSYSSDVLDASDVFSTFFYESPTYNNPKVTALIDEASQTTDQPKRLGILQQISKQVMDDVAWTPIGVGQVIFGFDKPYVIQKDVVGGLGVYFWQVYTQ